LWAAGLILILRIHAANIERNSNLQTISAFSSITIYFTFCSVAIQSDVLI